MKVYCMKIKSLKVLTKPFVLDDDGQAIASIRETIRTAPADEVKKIVLEDLELFSIGMFDSKNGLTNCRPKKIIDLVDIPQLLDIFKEAISKDE